MAASVWPRKTNGVGKCSLWTTAFSLLLVLVLIVGGLGFLSIPTSFASSPPTHELGFWIDDGSFSGVTAAQFVNGYFGTPPYPDFAQITIDFYQPGHTVSSESGVYVPILQDMAASYPNAKLMFQFFIVSNITTATVANQIASYSQFISAIAPYHSQILGVFYEPEYLTQGTDYSNWISVETQMKTIANNNGIPWILTQGGSAITDVVDHEITFVSWPFSGNEWGVANYSAQGQFYGAQIGFQSTWNYVFDGTGANAFPSVCTSLPAPTTTDITSTTAPLCVGTYNQLIINHIINDVLQENYYDPTGSGRTWSILTPGYSSNGGGMTFTGATGKTGQTAMWDNPTLRGWIWNSPNYQTNFVLSTTTISTTSTTSKTSTTSTTSSSTTSSSKTTTTSTTSTTSTTTAASTTPTVDSSSYVHTDLVSSTTITLTTHDSNDLIVVVVYSQMATTGYPQIASMSSPTLGAFTFVWRGTVSTNDAEMEVWTAVASKPLSSEVITITFESNEGYYCNIVALGINGANNASPFDVAPSNTGSITTTNANDIIINAVQSGNTNNPVAGNSAFTTLYSEAYYYGLAYVTTTSTQSSLSPNWDCNPTMEVYFAIRG